MKLKQFCIMGLKGARAHLELELHLAKSDRQKGGELRTQYANIFLSNYGQILEIKASNTFLSSFCTGIMKVWFT